MQAPVFLNRDWERGFAIGWELRRVAEFERHQPLIPTHMLQLLASVARKIEGEHTEMIAMLRARHSRRNRVPILRPVLDNPLFVVAVGRGC
jgi:hypothetical protein